MTRYQISSKKLWRRINLPFTPFHWGPSSWIGLIFFKIFDFPTLIISSVIVDIEPLYVLIFNRSLPIHGLLHTFLGGSILAILTAIICFLLKKQIKKVMKLFRLDQNTSFKKIILTSFIGVYLHILLDAFLYKDMNPFYPIIGNPFFNLFSSFQVYLFSSLSFLIGFIIYFFKSIFFNKQV